MGFPRVPKGFRGPFGKVRLSSDGGLGPVGWVRGAPRGALQGAIRGNYNNICPRLCDFLLIIIKTLNANTLILRAVFSVLTRLIKINLLGIHII